MNSSHLPINPDGLYKIPGFNQAMVSQGGKTLYIAGQAAYDEQMNLIGAGDYYLQTSQALQNIATVVTAAGGQPSDIVSSVLYVKGLGRVDAAKNIMAAIAVALDGKPFPAHAFSIVGVETLADPRILVEITAVAVIN